MFACRFGGESLADTGGTEEVHDETVSLALDEVIKADSAMMGFDKGTEEVLPIGREDEIGECIIIPIDVLDPVHIKFNYSERYWLFDHEKKGGRTPDFVNQAKTKDDSRGEKEVFFLQFDLGSVICRLSLHKVG